MDEVDLVDGVDLVEHALPRTLHVGDASGVHSSTQSTPSTVSTLSTNLLPFRICVSPRSFHPGEFRVCG